MKTRQGKDKGLIRNLIEIFTLRCPGKKAMKRRTALDKTVRIRRIMLHLGKKSNDMLV